MVGVWGAASRPKDLLFSPQQGDKVALLRRKRTVLGGFATLQTSRLVGDRVTRLHDTSYAPAQVDLSHWLLCS